MTGCGSKSSSQQSGINPAALLADIVKSVQQPVTSALAGWDWDSFINSANGFGTLLINFRYTLDMQKVTYTSTGADGKAHSMTGLLILPEAILGGKPSVPILMYQHGTEVYRPFSPSQYLAHTDRPTDYPEVMVAAAIASTGYAVALVDYEGMGDNTDPQPHVVGVTLAQQVIDLLRASRDIIGNSSSPCTWNSQLFLMGYSEGGYVTMDGNAGTAAKSCRRVHRHRLGPPLRPPRPLRHYALVNTIGQHLQGPLLCSHASHQLQLRLWGQTTTSAPALPCSPHTTPPFPRCFDGNSQSDTISEAMGMTFSPVTLIVPKSILTQQFIDQLTIDTSPAGRLPEAERLVPGPLNVNATWVPTVPMRMIHHKSDDLVPYGNSQVAFNAFTAARFNERRTGSRDRHHQHLFRPGQDDPLRRRLPGVDRWVEMARRLQAIDMKKE